MQRTPLRSSPPSTHHTSTNTIPYTHNQAHAHATRSPPQSLPSPSVQLLTLSITCMLQLGLYDMLHHAFAQGPSSPRMPTCLRQLIIASGLAPDTYTSIIHTLNTYKLFHLGRCRRYDSQVTCNRHDTLCGAQLTSTYTKPFAYCPWPSYNGNLNILPMLNSSLRTTHYQPSNALMRFPANALRTRTIGS